MYAPGTDISKDYNVSIVYDAHEKPLYYGWATQIGSYGDSFTNLTHILHVPYKSQAKSATDTGDYFMAAFAVHTDTLVYACDEYLPDTVTRIGHHFRYGQYDDCPSLKKAPAEYIPHTVDSIGDNFRYGQYSYCKELKESADEVFPSSVISIGKHFRENQYSYCDKLEFVGTVIRPKMQFDAIDKQKYYCSDNIKYKRYQSRIPVQ